MSFQSQHPRFSTTHNIADPMLTLRNGCFHPLRKWAKLHSVS
jgi:hypothetical protein